MLGRWWALQPQGGGGNPVNLNNDNNNNINNVNTEGEEENHGESSTIPQQSANVGMGLVDEAEQGDFDRGPFVFWSL